MKERGSKMARCYGQYMGSEYEVSVCSVLKVAMDKRIKGTEAEENAFLATVRLYEHQSEVTVVDNYTSEITTEGNFTVATQELDLRVKVRAYGYTNAYEEAEGEASAIIDNLPPGVSWVDCEAYDAEQGADVVDYDLAYDMACGN